MILYTLKIFKKSSLRIISLYKTDTRPWQIMLFLTFPMKFVFIERRKKRVNVEFFVAVELKTHVTSTSRMKLTLFNLCKMNLRGSHQSHYMSIENHYTIWLECIGCALLRPIEPEADLIAEVSLNLSSLDMRIMEIQPSDNIKIKQKVEQYLWNIWRFKNVHRFLQHQCFTQFWNT